MGENLIIQNAIKFDDGKSRESENHIRPNALTSASALTNVNEQLRRLVKECVRLRGLIKMDYYRVCVHVTICLLQGAEQ